MSVREVLERAMQVFKPTPGEEAEIARLAEEIMEEIRAESSNYPGIVGVSLEGSAAKRTWVRGREEVDIFVHFSRTVGHEDMEEEIVELGFKVLERLGGKPRLMYADHPYVEGRIGNVTVNVVACYRVDPPNWISATDRTPYHTRYIIERMDVSLRDDARLLKAFMMGCGVYGAEMKVRGFSGYLAELLTLHYGGFLGVIEAASTWKPPVVIDIEGHYDSSREPLPKIFPGQGLIVVDPVDRTRNVASAVSDEKLYEFILAAKLFLRSPSLKFFGVERQMDEPRKLERLADGRNFVAVLFRISEKRPPDVIWGELRKSERGVRKALETKGFKVYRSSSWTDEEEWGLIILEVDRLMLPQVELHEGPPVDHPRALEFVDKWASSGERVAGPWISGSRLYVLRTRREVDAIEILKSEMAAGRVMLAKGLADDIKSGLITASIGKLPENGELWQFLEDFLDGRPSFLK